MVGGTIANVMFFYSVGTAGKTLATYTLTVNVGVGATGSGTDPSGTEVPITAGTPPSGQWFKQRTVGVKPPSP